MKKTILHTVLTVLITFLYTSCQEESYKVKFKTDVNGYNYEEVSNDPFKARIYTLNNGLKIYLSKNTDEPRIQTMIVVKAGSKDEPRDNTGLAHYLEHMMFKGSTNLGTIDWEKEKPLIDSIAELFEIHKKAESDEERKTVYKKIDEASQFASQYAISNEYDKVTAALGASETNAFTGSDLTAYVNEIPSNELEKFIHLEYDRFNNLVLRLFHTELETVYEEFNMYQDMGNSLMWTTAYEELFDKHPYKVDVIGLPEHLKKPSMNSVMDFQKYYYVPNNMAICMVGDLDFEESVRIIDKYFGQMSPNENLKHPEPVKEEMQTTTRTREVYTPDEEMILVAYRYGDVKSEDAKYLDMIASILFNGKAGLIDLDLIQKQKVLKLNAGAENMKDYGVFYFTGSPRDGQSLEEIGILIQEEVQKLKNGDFNEELLEAIINNKKLQIIQITDSRYGCYDFMDAFINEISWKDYISQIDEQAKLSKDDIVKFANNFFKNNYVTVYKRTGENKDKITVEKPDITAIKINRADQSKFADDLLAIESEPIEPVFVDFKEKIKYEKIKDGIDFYYTKNESNNIYELNQFVNISNLTNKKLALAFRYLPYLGTSGYSPEELKLEMYKLGMYFNASSSSIQSYVTLFGLEETFDQSLDLMEKMLNDAVVDNDAFNNLINDILKERANNKLNKNIILRGGLANYAKYGSLSSFTDMLSEEELKSIDPQELIDIIKSFSSYKHGFYYYGTKSQSEIKETLNKIKINGDLKEVPEEILYPELPMDKPVVYFIDYDMVQAEIILLAKDIPFDPDILPYQSMFNSYYGSGMNSIIFQEIREARALAYSAYAYVTHSPRPNESNYIQAYVGTQSDKMKVAIDAFMDLLNEMPASEKSFNASKENVLSNMRSERLVKSDIFWTYMNWKKLGIDYDIRKPIFEKIQTMELNDIHNYFNEHIKPATYSILLIGKKDKIDFNYLKKYGEIKELTLEEVFGY